MLLHKNSRILGAAAPVGRPQMKSPGPAAQHPIHHASSSAPTPQVPKVSSPCRGPQALSPEGLDGAWSPFIPRASSWAGRLRITCLAVPATDSWAVPHCSW